MEDLIIIKPGNKVKIEYRRNKYPLELYVLYVGTELLQSLSDENTRLDEAFDIVPFQVKTVHSESESAMLIFPKSCIQCLRNLLNLHTHCMRKAC